MHIKEQVDSLKIKINEIPCLYVKPNNIDADLPCVIYYHGWHSSKEDNKFLATLLAHYGYKVIVPDQLYHGERGKLEYDKSEVLKQNFWNIIINGVEESKLFIQDAIDKIKINPDKIAVVGSSMGGFIASGVFAQNNNIRCLININGASAWKKAENIFREYDNMGLATKSQLEIISKYDPLIYKDTLYPRAILLLHGDSDTQIPIDIQRYFYKEMKKLYKNDTDKIKLVEVPGLNHHKTLGMIEETLDWLNTFL